MKKKELKKVKKELSFDKVTVLELNQLRQINGGDGGGDSPKNKVLGTLMTKQS
jgi:hypothetical protein